MKLHLSRADGRNRFSSYGPGFVVVNAARHERSLIVLPDRIVELEPAPGPDFQDFSSGPWRRCPHCRT